MYIFLYALNSTHLSLQYYMFCIAIEHLCTDCCMPVFFLYRSRHSDGGRSVAWTRSSPFHSCWSWGWSGLFPSSPQQVPCLACASVKERPRLTYWPLVRGCFSLVMYSILNPIRPCLAGSAGLLLTLYDWQIVLWYVFSMCEVVAQSQVHVARWLLSVVANAMQLGFVSTFSTSSYYAGRLCFPFSCSAS